MKRRFLIFQILLFTSVVFLPLKNIKNHHHNQNITNTSNDDHDNSKDITNNYDLKNTGNIINSAINRQKKIDEERKDKVKVIVNNDSEDYNTVSGLNYGYTITYNDFHDGGSKQVNQYVDGNRRFGKRDANGNNTNLYYLGQDDSGADNDTSDANAYVSLSELFNIKIQINGSYQPNTKVTLDSKYKQLIEYQALMSSQQPGSIYYSIEATGILSCPKICLVQHWTDKDTGKKESVTIGQYGVYNFFSINGAWAISLMSILGPPAILIGTSTLFGAFSLLVRGSYLYFTTGSFLGRVAEDVDREAQDLGRDVAHIGGGNRRNPQLPIGDERLQHNDALANRERARQALQQPTARANYNAIRSSTRVNDDNTRNVFPDFANDESYTVGRDFIFCDGWRNRLQYGEENNPKHTKIVYALNPQSDALDKYPTSFGNRSEFPIDSNGEATMGEYRTKVDFDTGNLSKAQWFFISRRFGWCHDMSDNYASNIERAHFLRFAMIENNNNIAWLYNEVENYENLGIRDDTLEFKEGIKRGFRSIKEDIIDPLNNQNLTDDIKRQVYDNNANTLRRKYDYIKKINRIAQILKNKYPDQFGDINEITDNELIPIKKILWPHIQYDVVDEEDGVPPTGITSNDDLRQEQQLSQEQQRLQEERNNADRAFRLPNNQANFETDIEDDNNYRRINYKDYAQEESYTVGKDFIFCDGWRNKLQYGEEDNPSHTKIQHAFNPQSDALDKYPTSFGNRSEFPIDSNGEATMREYQAKIQDHKLRLSKLQLFYITRRFGWKHDLSDNYASISERIFILDFAQTNNNIPWLCREIDDYENLGIRDDTLEFKNGIKEGLRSIRNNILDPLKEENITDNIRLQVYDKNTNKLMRKYEEIQRINGIVRMLKRKYPVEFADINEISNNELTPILKILYPNRQYDVVDDDVPPDIEGDGDRGTRPPDEQRQEQQRQEQQLSQEQQRLQEERNNADRAFRLPNNQANFETDIEDDNNYRRINYKDYAQEESYTVGKDFIFCDGWRNKLQYGEEDNPSHTKIQHAFNPQSDALDKYPTSFGNRSEFPIDSNGEATMREYQAKIQDHEQRLSKLQLFYITRRFGWKHDLSDNYASISERIFILNFAETNNTIPWLCREIDDYENLGIIDDTLEFKNGIKEGLRSIRNNILDPLKEENITDNIRLQVYDKNTNKLMRKYEEIQRINGIVRMLKRKYPVEFADINEISNNELTPILKILYPNRQYDVVDEDDVSTRGAPGGGSGDQTPPQEPQPNPEPDPQPDPQQEQQRLQRMQELDELRRLQELQDQQRLEEQREQNLPTLDPEPEPEPEPQPEPEPEPNPNNPFTSDDEFDYKSEGGGDNFDPPDDKKWDRAIDAFKNHPNIRANFSLDNPEYLQFRDENSPDEYIDANAFFIVLDWKNLLEAKNIDNISQSRIKYIFNPNSKKIDKFPIYYGDRLHFPVDSNGDSEMSEYRLTLKGQKFSFLRDEQKYFITRRFGWNYDLSDNYASIEERTWFLENALKDKEIPWLASEVNYCKHLKLEDDSKAFATNISINLNLMKWNILIKLNDALKLQDVAKRTKIFEEVFNNDYSELKRIYDYIKAVNEIAKMLKNDYNEFASISILSDNNFSAIERILSFNNEEEQNENPIIQIINESKNEEQSQQDTILHDKIHHLYDLEAFDQSSDEEKERIIQSLYDDENNRVSKHNEDEALRGQTQSETVQNEYEALLQQSEIEKNNFDINEAEYQRLNDIKEELYIQLYDEWIKYFNESQTLEHNQELNNVPLHEREQYERDFNKRMQDYFSNQKDEHEENIMKMRNHRRATKSKFNNDMIQCHDLYLSALEERNQIIIKINQLMTENIENEEIFRCQLFKEKIINIKLTSDERELHWNTIKDISEAEKARSEDVRLEIERLNQSLTEKNIILDKQISAYSDINSLYKKHIENLNKLNEKFAAKLLEKKEEYGFHIQKIKTKNLELETDPTSIIDETPISSELNTEEGATPKPSELNPDQKWLEQVLHKERIHIEREERRMQQYEENEAKRIKEADEELEQNHISNVEFQEWYKREFHIKKGTYISAYEENEELLIQIEQEKVQFFNDINEEKHKLILKDAQHNELEKLENEFNSLKIQRSEAFKEKIKKDRENFIRDRDKNVETRDGVEKDCSTAYAKTMEDFRNISREINDLISENNNNKEIFRQRVFKERIKNLRLLGMEKDEHAKIITNISKNEDLRAQEVEKRIEELNTRLNEITELLSSQKEEYLNLVQLYNNDIRDLFTSINERSKLLKENKEYYEQALKKYIQTEMETKLDRLLNNYSNSHSLRRGWVPQKSVIITDPETEFSNIRKIWDSYHTSLKQYQRDSNHLRDARIGTCSNICKTEIRILMQSLDNLSNELKLFKDKIIRVEKNRTGPLFPNLEGINDIQELKQKWFEDFYNENPKHNQYKNNIGMIQTDLLINNPDLKPIYEEEMKLTRQFELFIKYKNGELKLSHDTINSDFINMIRNRWFNDFYYLNPRHIEYKDANGNIIEDNIEPESPLHRILHSERELINEFEIIQNIQDAIQKLELFKNSFVEISAENVRTWYRISKNTIFTVNGLEPMQLKTIIANNHGKMLSDIYGDLADQEIHSAFMRKKKEIPIQITDINGEKKYITANLKDSIEILNSGFDSNLNNLNAKIDKFNNIRKQLIILKESCNPEDTKLIYDINKYLYESIIEFNDVLHSEIFLLQDYFNYSNKFKNIYLKSFNFENGEEIINHYSYEWIMNEQRKLKNIVDLENIHINLKLNVQKYMYEHALSHYESTIVELENLDRARELAKNTEGYEEVSSKYREQFSKALDAKNLLNNADKITDTLFDVINDHLGDYDNSADKLIEIIDNKIRSLSSELRLSYNKSDIKTHIDMLKYQKNKIYSIKASIFELYKSKYDFEHTYWNYHAIKENLMNRLPLFGKSKIL